MMMQQKVMGGIDNRVIFAPMQTSYVHSGDSQLSMPNTASPTNLHRIFLGGTPSIAIGSNGRYYDNSAPIDSILDNDDLSFTSGGFSASIRTNLSALSSANGVLFAKAEGTSYEYLFSLRNDFLMLWLLSSDGANQLVTKVPLTEAEVTSNILTLGFTWDGTNLNSGVNLYKNGVVQTVGKVSENTGTFTGMTNTGAKIFLGRWQPSPIWGITGYLKNFHLDKGVNTAEQMLAYHNEA